MKILNTFCAFLFLVNVAVSQESYSRVQIDLDDIDLMSIAKLGLETDHGIHKPGRYFINDFSNSELQVLEQHDIAFSILIDDVQSHYVNQNLHDHLHTEVRSEHCNSGGYLYKTPDNYKYGSMGGYHTYDEMISTLDSMNKKFPHLISRLKSIGDYKTEEGRSIHWLKVGNNPNQDENGKPEVLYTALHHAREPNSLSQMIFFLWYLLENYETDETVKFIVDHTELYFIPCVNPDGYIFNQTTNPEGGGLWRKNRAVINNFVAGVDLNRNYGFEWAHDNQGSSGNPNSNTYRGPEAFSEPETQAVRAFCLQHDFKVALNYHTFGNLMIYPWGYSNGQTPDDLTFKGFAKAMTSENEFFAGTGIETVGYTVNGDSDDWMYGEDNILAMTPEVGSGEYGFWPPKSAIDQLNKSALKQNLVAALLLHQYYEAELDLSTDGEISIDVTKYSLDEKPLKLRIEGLDERITFEQSVLESELKHLESDRFTVSYTINDSETETTSSIKFLVIRDLDGLDMIDTFALKIDNDLEPIFEESAENLMLWNTEKWGVSNTTFVAAPSSFTDSPDGNYEENTINTLDIDEAIDLSSYQEAKLEYYAKWDIEPDFDYAQVMISTDGINFESICTDHSSTGNEFQALDEPIYEGKQVNWVKESIDLKNYLGGKIWIRFLMVSDQFEHRDGIYIDEIIIRAKEEASSSVGPAPLTHHKLLISPNPVSNILNIEITDGKSKLSSLTITDAFGQVLMNKTVAGSKSELTLSHLSSGVYFIAGFSSDGKIMTGKFIKL